MKRGFMKNYFIIFIIIFSLSLYGCVRRSATEDANEHFSEDAINHQEGMFVETHEESQEKMSNLLSTFGDSSIYFFGQFPHLINSNSLFEIRIENDELVLSRIDFINGDKIYIERVILTEEGMRFIDGVDQLAFGFRGFFTGFWEWLSVFISSDGNITICATLNFVQFVFPQSNNIKEILAELQSNRAETQMQYTGRFVFERMEILNDIGVTIENLGDWQYGWVRPKIRTEEINISFTGAGNLYVSGIPLLFGNFAYINDHDNPEFVIDYGASSGVSHFEILMFSDDYLIIHFEYRSWGIGGGIFTHSEYRIYYRRTTNDT